MPVDLKVAIEADIDAGGSAGGGEQYVTSLIRALGVLGDKHLDCLIVGPSKDSHWLSSVVGVDQKLVVKPSADTNRHLKQALGPIRPVVGRQLRRIRKLVLSDTGLVPVSSGFYENLGVGVIHFTSQSYVRTKLRSAYSPHDLQHRHFPQFFSRDQHRVREAMTSIGCREADVVIADSHWVREDIIEQFRLDGHKVIAIHWGSPTEFYEPLVESFAQETISRLAIPTPYIFFPAQTWPHKNHIRLISALRYLRDEGIEIDLVCSGRKNDFFPQIMRHVHKEGLEDRVHFVGWVSVPELRALYARSRAVVFPSLFEGGGFPILEGMAEGVPVICSNVTCLPEYGGNAVEYFDPNSTEAMARAISSVITDDTKRALMIKRGGIQSKRFSWASAARKYRDAYRLAMEI